MTMEKNDQSGVSAEDLPSKCQSLRLRSIRKRIETEQNKHLPKIRRPRERPAPLSKYRRRTANARERQRMHEVNVAFELLKSTIPHHKLKQIDEKKDTKITTLRCAITYINSLSELLEDIENGKTVSPEYYFSDAQLGLEPENKKKKRNQRGKGGLYIRRGKEQNTKGSRADVRRVKNKAEAIDISKHLEHINLPAALKILLANSLKNKTKKFNKSSPYMIDNRPKIEKKRKKSLSVVPNGTVIVQNNTNYMPENSQCNVLQALFTNNHQNVANINQFTPHPNSTSTLRPVVIARRNGGSGNNTATEIHRPTEVSTSIDNIYSVNLNGEIVAPKHSLIVKLPTEVTFGRLTPILPSNLPSLHSGSLTSEFSKIGSANSSPPAAVLALARNIPSNKTTAISNDQEDPILTNNNNNNGCSTTIPFSTKGLQPISTHALQQFCSESNSSSLIYSNVLTTLPPASSPIYSAVSPSPSLSICSTSPSSSSSVASSLSPSFSGISYQNEDKMNNIAQDQYSPADDISDLTPSLTTIDLEHQLMSGIDYSNMGSIQEFLGEFENSTNQQQTVSETITEVTTNATSSTGF